ncbi:MAG: PTS sugar transporter subunit IIC [Candidatus Adiutrix sp.]|jgi:uncharacterized membrane protein|nr:PTS sugar transporter subunit IIC [Candidatus Adiutrix sp.]
MSTGQPAPEKIGFLKRKNIEISFQRYGIEALGAMALGLFATLLVGTILKTAGDAAGVAWLSEFGVLAQSMMGPGIAVAVAFGLKSPPLVLFASTVVGAAAVKFGGGPAGCFVAALISAEFGKIVSKETKVDILVTPLVAIIVGVAVAKFIGPPIGSFMKQLGELIMWATNLQPIPMGVLVSVLMGLALTAPISSAAICIMLELSGLAAGAATVGCCCQMVGFAVASYRENKVGGLVAIGLGTSMLLVPKILRHPMILVPPTLASAILGPIATTIIPMQNVPIGAGMGTSGLVGQIGTITAMGFSAGVLVKIAMLQIILPAVLAIVFSEFMRKKGLIKFGQQQLVDIN